MSETFLAEDHFISDKLFDCLYPKQMQLISSKHWTPLSVATSAAGFLGKQPGSRILDIGSGIGKFCLAAGNSQPQTHVYGVEQRINLVRYAEKAKKRTQVANVTFIHGDFTQLDLNEFDHFYFYNSFYENLVDREFRIDENIGYSLRLYEYYTHYLFKALEQKPSGTRLATYHSFREVVPDGYYLAESHHNSLLRCWIKE